MMAPPLESRRAVVTGIGVLSAIGIGQEAFWRALVSGTCGITDLEHLDARLRVRRGCVVKGFRDQDFPVLERFHVVGRASRFAVAAARLALTDATLAFPFEQPDRVGVSLGTTGGEIQIVESLCRGRVRGEPLDGRQCAQLPCHVIPANVARSAGARGPQFVFPNACAAGNYAIGYGYDLIRSARADVMLAGGVEAFSEMALIGFARLNTVAPDVCRPFDKNRRGIVLGEGAGILVLEELTHALRRGARVYAEIGGYGISCDSYHVTSPDPTGSGMRAAMHRALAAAGCMPADIDYINAHGSGTQVNDEVETRAIKDLFGAHAHQLKVSSTKSMIGHTMGAASAIEAATCALAVHHGVLPPTIHYETPDPECDLDYVPNRSVEAAVEVAMNNAFAFGGKNICLLVRRYRA
jgi:3-oxoacyl-[acyl-carrier-protein] synthase II